MKTSGGSLHPIEAPRPRASVSPPAPGFRARDRARRQRRTAAPRELRDEVVELGQPPAEAGVLGWSLSSVAAVVGALRSPADDARPGVADARRLASRQGAAADLAHAGAERRMYVTRRGCGDARAGAAVRRLHVTPRPRLTCIVLPRRFRRWRRGCRSVAIRPWRSWWRLVAWDASVRSARAHRAKRSENKAFLSESLTLHHSKQQRPRAVMRRRPGPLRVTRRSPVPLWVPLLP